MSQSLPTQLRVHRSIGGESPRRPGNALLDDEAAPFPGVGPAGRPPSSRAAALPQERVWAGGTLTLWRGHRLVAAAPAYAEEACASNSGSSSSTLLGHRQRAGGASPPLPGSWCSPRRLTPPPAGASWCSPARTARSHPRAGPGGAGARPRQVTLPGPRPLPHCPGGRGARAAGLRGRRHGVQYHFLNAGYRTPEDVLQRFNSKRRNQIRRERRAPAAQGLEIGPCGAMGWREVDPKGSLPPVPLHGGEVRLGPPVPHRQLLRQGPRALPTPGGAGPGPPRRPRGGPGVQPLQRPGPLRSVLGMLRGGALPPFQRLHLCRDGRDGAPGLLRFEPGAGRHKLVRGSPPA